MELEQLNPGASANDKQGDRGRDAFLKIQRNFAAIELESNSQAQALSDKVDKVPGKGLSTNDFTNEDVTALAALAQGVADLGESKVDKVPGKGLSDNNFTDEAEAKLAALESSRFKGLFDSLASLQAAHPAGEAGDYANVDQGVGSNVQRYLWDTSDSQWVLSSGTSTEMTPAQVKASYESNPNTNAYTDAEKAKLAGVESGATANQTNAFLLPRANHTDTQPIATVTGLQVELDAKATLTSVAASYVAKTSDTGIALLPEGNDAQRPVTGSIPAGAAIVRGNTQSPANYFLEFWNSGVSAWHVFASQPWVQGLIDAITGRVSTLESFGKCRAWANIRGTGQVGLRASANVSSVTWVSVGVYRVNFAIPMPNTEYVVVVGGEPAGGTGNKYYGYAVTPAYATVNVYNGAGALADSSIINVVVFG